MTTNKDVKRVIRTRMQKTGESYTAARAIVLNRGKVSAKVPEPVAAVAAKVAIKDYAAVAGHSDATIKVRTGCDWKSWVGALDYVGAPQMTHREIAAHLREKHGVSMWWAQAVTVGYERIRGLRETGQRRGGLYEVSVSKTVAVPVATLYKVFVEPSRRRKWLHETGVRVRTAVENKSMRMTWSDGTSVEVYFTGKGAGKSIVTVQHVKLPTQEDREVRRGYWRDRLARMSALVGPAQG